MPEKELQWRLAPLLANPTGKLQASVSGNSLYKMEYDQLRTQTHTIK